MSTSLFGSRPLILNLYQTVDVNPLKSLKIDLQTPKGLMINLSQGQIRNLTDTTDNCIDEIGRYFVQVSFSSDNHKVDTIIQDFQIFGQETSVLLQVSLFPQSIVDNKSHARHNTGNTYGRLEINRFQKGPSTTVVSLDKKARGNDYYKGPFFRIENHSKDTLYSDQYCGLFWGNLFKLKSDSTWRELPSTLDGNFGGSPPLEPNGTTTGTVGSFGLHNIMPNGRYKFVFIYSMNKGRKINIVKKISNNFDWLIQIMDYYVADYEYESNEY